MRNRLHARAAGDHQLSCVLAARVEVGLIEAERAPRAPVGGERNFHILHAVAAGASADEMAGLVPGELRLLRGNEATAWP